MIGFANGNGKYFRLELIEKKNKFRIKLYGYRYMIFVPRQSPTIHAYTSRMMFFFLLDWIKFLFAYVTIPSVKDLQSSTILILEKIITIEVFFASGGRVGNVCVCKKKEKSGLKDTKIWWKKATFQVNSVQSRY